MGGCGQEGALAGPRAPATGVQHLVSPQECAGQGSDADHTASHHQRAAVRTTGWQSISFQTEHFTSKDTRPFFNQTTGEHEDCRARETLRSGGKGWSLDGNLAGHNLEATSCRELWRTWSIATFWTRRLRVSGRGSVCCLWRPLWPAGIATPWSGRANPSTRCWERRLSGRLPTPPAALCANR